MRKSKAYQRAKRNIYVSITLTDISKETSFSSSRCYKLWPWSLHDGQYSNWSKIMELVAASLDGKVVGEMQRAEA